MTATKKDTIYIDIDDEITSVIEKVVSSKHKIVALVLPKHPTVFQSIVNLKLLKKAATSSKKQLVLISSDQAVLAIASTTSVHVAKTLATKPSIPEAQVAAKPEPAVVQVAEKAPDDAKESVSEDKSVQDDDSIVMDDDKGKKAVAVGGAAVAAKAKKLMKIPDFSKFSVRLGLGITAGIALIVLWVFGFVILPRATVTISTDVMTKSINEQVTASIEAEELDVENNILPANRVQTEKIDSVTVQATGEKNIGKKATGELTLTNCIKDDEKKVIPAGTSFSKEGQNFVTAEQVILGPAAYVGNTCISGDFPGLGAQKDVDAIASASGESYNVSEGTFNSSISGIQAFGSDMKGGTTEIVTVISESDVQNATSQLSGSTKNEAVEELKSELETQQLKPIDESLHEGEPVVDVTPAVGQEAAEVKVTVTKTYSLLGIAESDIATLLDALIEEILADEQKNVRDNGLADIRFRIVDRPDTATTRFTIEAVAKIGPELIEDTIKNMAVGKKRGEIIGELESIEGVKTVTVEYSPAWITTTPKSASKINVLFIEEDEQ